MGRIDHYSINPPTTQETPMFKTNRYVRDAGVYDVLEHNPNHPFVVVSYSVFKRSILQQWHDLVEGGMTFIAQIDDPYESSAEMLEEVIMNTELRVFADNGASLPDGHPMKESVDVAVDGFKVYNDIFRGVHDIMGHVLAGSSFGPKGEEGAWLAHKQTLPRLAWPALWCETRGQTAWTNFADDHETVPLKDRPFGAQKAGLVPLTIVS